MVKIPRIIFARVMSRKISAGHVGYVFSVDADVSARVVDVRLHQGKCPRAKDEKNIIQR